VHTPLAGRIQQMVDHQQFQHFLPAHGLAAVRQARRQKSSSPVAANLTSQPAVAKQARPPQFQPLSFTCRLSTHLRNLAVFGEKAEGARTLLLLVEDFEVLRQAACCRSFTSPGRGRALRRLAGGQPRFSTTLK